MKAVVVTPGKPRSVRLWDVSDPSADSVAGGRGVLVKVLQVGLDGTDKEIASGEYGKAPPGEDFLILGHERLGRVEGAGENVTELRVGDYVTATVRRPGSSLYDQIGLCDMTTDEVYYEPGISLIHGCLTEYFVDRPEFLVRIPTGLRHVAVLTEPASVVQKAVSQAYEIQRRLGFWHPRRVALLGAGTLGLLAALTLRQRGLDVVAMGLPGRPLRNADLLEEIGAHYVSAQDLTLRQLGEMYGPFDLVLEATGCAERVFEAMQVLGKNGLLVMLSITGGKRTMEIPCDAINMGFVLGNKVAVGSVGSNREHFALAVKDLSQAEVEYPGWLSKLLTHRVVGLDKFQVLFDTLTKGEGVIKVFCEVASMPIES